MDFEALLGRQLKDDDIIEILEEEDMEVIYIFDRTHEGEEDQYSAEAKEAGLEFRFDQNQRLEVIFLYAAAREDGGPIALDEADFPVYTSFDEAKKGFSQAGISFKESPGKSSWIRGEFENCSRHYEFHDNALYLVTLMAKPT